VVEIATFVGTFGLFFTCFLLFCRFLPMIAVAEVKAVVAEETPNRKGEALVEPSISPTARQEPRPSAPIGGVA
jgi:molybdopterin-containing oxidoreductase family membrane subunit